MDVVAQSLEGTNAENATSQYATQLFRLGGRVWAEGEVNKGGIFDFTIARAPLIERWRQ